MNAIDRYYSYTKGRLPVWQTILLIILSITFIILASCRSNKVATTETTDSTVVHNLHVQDSLHAALDFKFDQLDVWYYDSISVDTSSTAPRSHLLKHICITKGSASSTIVKNKEKAVCDSTYVATEKHVEPVLQPPKLRAHLIILIMAIIAIIIIASRLRL